MTELTPGRSSKAERAYQLIRGRILEGDYPPGHRLVLDHVARELAVSPVPVREAVRRLEAEGYVEFRRNVGAQVAGADYGDTIRTLALLEGAATAMATRHLTEQDLRRAQEVNDAIRTCLTRFDPQEFTRLNHAFHKILCTPCPNPHLRGLLGREWSRLRIVRRADFRPVPGLAARSADDHDHLLRLIAAGAPESEVERAAREHKLAMQQAAEQPHLSAAPAPAGMETA